MSGWIGLPGDVLPELLAALKHLEIVRQALPVDLESDEWFDAWMNEREKRDPVRVTLIPISPMEEK